MFDVKKMIAALLLVCLLLPVAGAHAAESVEAAQILLAGYQAESGRLVAQLEAWDCAVFVHYSFPSLMDTEEAALRCETMKAALGAAGIEWIDRYMPDPDGQGGLPALEQFMQYDVPVALALFEGEPVAFFTGYEPMEDWLEAAIEPYEFALFPVMR